MQKEFKMLEINIKKDYNINDIGTEYKVKSILNNLKFSPDDYEIKLDIRQCLIDYDATSKLLDFIINHLSKIKGKKSLIIIYDFILDKQTLLNWMFLGSTLFGLEKNKESELNEIEETLDKHLTENEIKLIINILDRNEKKLNNYEYPRR
jgi:hypothetical protein